MREEARRSARAHALRAAAAVTLGLAASGCALSHEPGGGTHEDAAVARDSGTDAGAVACSDIFPPATRPCCESMGFSWDESIGRCLVAVPGPFVPPALDV